MTHVTADVLRPLVERFGDPAEWDGTRPITERDVATVQRSTAHEAFEETTRSRSTPPGGCRWRS